MCSVGFFGQTVLILVHSNLFGRIHVFFLEASILNGQGVHKIEKHKIIPHKRYHLYRAKRLKLDCNGFR